MGFVLTKQSIFPQVAQARYAIVIISTYSLRVPPLLNIWSVLNN